jgi:tetratricopeptide (TPR) repeat protein
MQFPNEPKQIRPGEDVHVVQDPAGGQRVQVAGQVAVMAINGLLTKVIFDHNPDNEFFVEESFPLDWMYPYLTPYGVIMKINRNPLPELTDEICQRDHEFWKQYSKRLCGDFIDYDTPVKTIAEWAEKTYLRRDFNGYIGDIKFALDNDGQKAFSKLRSSIGGIYSWRVGNARTQVEQARMIREADFALKQAFAFCPYSPEAVYRYVQLLANTGRFEDALIVADTCLKLDPFNGSIIGLRDNLKQNVDYMKAHPTAGAAAAPPVASSIETMESRFKSNPEDLQNAFALAGSLLRNQRTNDAWAVFDGLAGSPKVDAGTLMAIAKFYADGSHLAKLEGVLQKLTQVASNIPESWYDYAALESVLNKPDKALPALRKAVEMSDSRPKGSDVRNLREDASRDGRFVALRAMPEFRNIVGTN